MKPMPMLTQLAADMSLWLRIWLANRIMDLAAVAEFFWAISTARALLRLARRVAGPEVEKRRGTIVRWF